MTSDAPTVFVPAEVARPRFSDAQLLFAGYAILVLLQFGLIWTKGINWDEFLHFSQVHDLNNGRLVWVFQTLHARMFAWVPAIASDPITQIQIARIGMLGFEIVAAGAVVVLARRFASRGTALLAGLIYMASSAVFLHGFSFRADPMATATLMTALCLLVTCRLRTGTILLAGALIGIAGMMTIKSILYLPCFVGAGLLRLGEEERTGRFAVAAKIATVPLVAGAVFAVVFALHQIGIASDDTVPNAVGSRASRFLGSGLFLRWNFTVSQFLGAPLLTAALVTTIFMVKNRPAGERIFILAMLAPLLSLIFYRNTYPYFFVFLFAPVCAAITPALDVMVNRYGLRPILAVLAMTPLALLVSQPYGLLPRQRAQIDEIHRLFPQPVGYLAYTSFVPDYPRIIPFLISGLGLKRYHDGRQPGIARKIAAGEVAFVLADSPPIIAGLEGKRIPGTLLKEDFSMLDGNFLHYTEALWLSGKKVCTGQGRQTVHIVRPGPYTLDGGALTIDGIPVENGRVITLARGAHTINHAGEGCVRLWNLPETPRPPVDYPPGPAMEGF